MTSPLDPPEWQVRNNAESRLMAWAGSRSIDLTRTYLFHWQAIRALQEAEILGDFSRVPAIIQAVNNCRLLDAALPNDFHARLSKVQNTLQNRGRGRPRASPLYRQLIRDLYRMTRTIGWDVNEGPLGYDDTLRRLSEKVFPLRGVKTIETIIGGPIRDPRVMEMDAARQDFENLNSWLLDQRREHS